MILAGDVGGSKVNLALFHENGGTPRLAVERSYGSRDYPGPLPLLESFLKETQPRITRACLGVAGPVHDGRCRITHLPWTLDVRELKTLLGTDSVFLINDLAALAYAVPYLSPEDVAVIQEGQVDSQGTVGMLAAGTGLGQAVLLPNPGGRVRVLETEGGQCDFAARTALEAGMLEFIREESGRVAIEDVLSGPGLIRLYRFFKQRTEDSEPEWLTAELETQDPAAVISKNGLSGKFKPCQQALELWVSVYGAVAGNLALQVMTRGGIVLGGGIAPEILPLLKTDLFLEAFRDKGKFREFLAQVPIQVVINKQAPLTGAAYFALGETGIQ